MGFEAQTGLRFQRQDGTSFQRVTFSTRSDRSGRVRYSVNLALRFPHVQAILEPEGEGSSTIGTPLHLLRPNRTYTEWEIDAVSDVERQKDTVLQDIEKWGFPFLQTYSDLGKVKLALESSDPRDWFVLDAEGRTATLAAIEFAQGERASALSRLDRVLAELEEAPFKKRYPLQLLRERISKAV
jgi:hypothetical protein